MFPLLCSITSFVTRSDVAIIEISASNSEPFIWPLDSTKAYDFEIDWGDGSIETYTGALTNVNHQYSITGTYDVSVKGLIGVNCIYQDLYGGEFLSVKEWGTSPWLTLRFDGQSNFQILATDIPNLSQTDSLDNAFNRTAIGGVSDPQTYNLWDVGTIKTFPFAFSRTSFNSPLDGWDVSNAESFRGTFFGTPFNQPLNTWDIRNVTDLYAIFGATPFDQPLFNWEPISCEDMSFIFYQTPFNQNINNWDVSSVKSFRSVFSENTAFNQPLDSWDISNGEDFDFVFNQSPFNQPLPSWRADNALSAVSMFNGSPFNQDIPDMFSSGTCQDFASIFYEAGDFNGSILNWDLSSCTRIGYAFGRAYSFNQPVNQLDVSLVGDFSGTFYQATNFNQPIDEWNPINATEFEDFIIQTGFSTQNYDDLLASWSQLNFVNDGLLFEATDTQYTDQASRDILTNPPNNWTINDAGLYGAWVNTDPWINSDPWP